MMVPGLPAAGRVPALGAAIDGDGEGIRRALAPRERSVSLAMEPMDGSASPRKPSVRMANRSSSASLEVAWRSTDSARSSGPMPQPLSVTRMRERPPEAVDDLDLGCAGVERILDELLHDARRALDDLARRDAVDRLRR